MVGLATPRIMDCAWSALIGVCHPSQATKEIADQPAVDRKGTNNEQGAYTERHRHQWDRDVTKVNMTSPTALHRIGAVSSQCSLCLATPPPPFPSAGADTHAFAQQRRCRTPLCTRRNEPQHPVSANKKAVVSAAAKCKQHTCGEASQQKFPRNIGTIKTSILEL
jgi:hypothetical protein